MYYRVAVQIDSSANLQWKSTVLSELSALMQFLRLYRAFPPDRLRVFSSASREELCEQLMRENQGRASASVTAAQFLHERLITSTERVWGTSTPVSRENGSAVSVVTIVEPLGSESSQAGHVLDGWSRSPLEKRRQELERGEGGDHDLPYQFCLPGSMPQTLAWVTLLVRVREGAFQS